MPNTLIPIQTVTLSSTSSSITFSNIPQNYTDLKLVASTRANSTNSGYERLGLGMAFNGSLSDISSKFLYGDGSSTTSFTYTNGYIGWMPAADATANTYSTCDIRITNYTSANHKSFSVDFPSVNNSTTTSKVSLCVVSGLWSQTAAITSLTFSVEGGGLFASGSSITLYGISNGVKAVGGTLTVAGGYAYHTFTSTGSFLPSQKITGAEILCTAGGAGGAGTLGGGGGAGGVLYASSQTLNAGNSYTALVGSGGSGGATQVEGSSGSNSVFSSLIAIGGGGGGRGGSPANAGRNGGSGGGAYATGTPGTGTSGQGNNGGSGVSNENSGGGGGAGAVGGTATTTVPGVGGIGTSAYTTWHSVTSTGVLSGGFYYIAGGGGGGGFSYNGGQGGRGGGGSAGDSGGSVGYAATANTGGGGGGASYNNGTQYAGGAGGSGLVIVRYPLS
jgi:hypothetical protein